MTSIITLHLSYKGAKEVFILQLGCEGSFEGIQRLLGLSNGVMKLVIKGMVVENDLQLRSIVDQETSRGTSTLAALVLFTPQADVESIQNSHDLPGLASIAHEEMRELRRAAAGTLAGMAPPPPSGPYTFQSYRVLDLPGVRRDPREALTLLHRLAADPGIRGIMERHKWTVGVLSEMAPAGKVGVDPVCVLGVNKNKGQEISLRLRTDDLRGFRRYDRIVETLIHELAHMVHSDHDIHFKTLNSQLLKECAALGGGRDPGAGLGAAEYYGGPELSTEQAAALLASEQQRVMAETAAQSGRRLRDLAGDGGLGSGGYTESDPATAAREAALRRLGEDGTSGTGPGRGPSPGPSSQADGGEAGASAEPSADPGASVPTPRLGQEDEEPARPASTSPPLEPQPVPTLPAAAPARPAAAAITAEDPFGGAAGAAMFAGLGAALDPVVAKTQRIQARLAELRGLPGPISAIERVLGNLIANPGEDRYRRLRLDNATVSNSIGRYPAALALLEEVGFAREPAADGSGLGGAGLLRLRRHDPGLVYLALELVRGA